MSITAGLIKQPLPEVLNAVACGLKWCSHHKRWEHFSDFFKSRNSKWGLTPFCKEAAHEKWVQRRGPLIKPRKRNCDSASAWKSAYVNLVRQTGKIKQSCRSHITASCATIHYERKSDHVFDLEVRKAYYDHYKNKYGSDYVKIGTKGKAYETNPINEDHLTFLKEHKELLHGWFKAGALSHNFGRYLGKCNIDDIIGIAELSFIYSALRNVHKKEYLAKFYGRCALYSWMREYKKEIFDGKPYGRGNPSI